MRQKYLLHRSHYFEGAVCLPQNGNDKKTSRVENELAIILRAIRETCVAFVVSEEGSVSILVVVNPKY